MATDPAATSGSPQLTVDWEESCRRKQRNEELKAMLTQMSVAGLSRAASASVRSVKIFWTLLFAVGLIGFTCNLIAIGQRFNDAPRLMQMNYEFKPFTWPDITFCNPSNPIPFWNINGSKTRWSRLVAKARKYPRLLYKGAKEVNIFEQYLAMSSLTPLEAFRAPVSSLILHFQVRFSGDSISTSSGGFDQFIRVTNFSRVFIQRLDSSRIPLICYTLKPEGLKKQKMPHQISATHSIKLSLIMDRDSYGFYNFGYENRKLYLYISNPNGTVSSGSLHFIYPGTHSEFIIKEHFFRRRVDCNDDTYPLELYDANYHSWHEYNGSLLDCKLRISQQTFLRRCGCFNPFLPIYRLTDSIPKLCLNMSLYSPAELRRNVECMNRVANKTGKDPFFHDAFEQNCSRYQQPQCSLTTYSCIRHTNNWQLDMNANRRVLMLDAVRRLPNGSPNASEDFYLKNLASVELRRGHLKTTGTVEEYSYPTSQFSSDIGGILGLWLGMGVINLFEIVEFVSVLIWSCCGRNHRHK